MQKINLVKGRIFLGNGRACVTMLSKTLLFACLSWMFLPCYSQSEFDRCHSTEQKINQLTADPEAATSWEVFLNKDKLPLQVSPRTDHIIPVVVHLVWYDPAEDYNDEIVAEQIRSLNLDFQNAHFDQQFIPEAFKPLSSNTQISFCLAQVDPDGQATTGITRRQTSEDCVGGVFTTGNLRLIQDEDHGTAAWDPERYLNIWVGRTCSFLGVSSFPDDAGQAYDGIVLDPTAFGTRCVEGPFNLGRTLTHEIGHYLGLFHPWGPGVTASCDEDDLVDDTPHQGAIYLGCPDYPASSCGSSDMYMNFMNYCHDRCLLLFTPGQKARMHSTLMQERQTLVSQAGCFVEPEKKPLSAENIILFPNPMLECLHIQLREPNTSLVDVRIVDRFGRSLFAGSRHLDDPRPIVLPTRVKGLYFLYLESEDERLVKKFIIQ